MVVLRRSDLCAGAEPVENGLGDMHGRHMMMVRPIEDAGLVHRACHASAGRLYLVGRNA